MKTRRKEPTQCRVCGRWIGKGGHIDPLTWDYWNGGWEDSGYHYCEKHNPYKKTVQTTTER